MLLFMLYVNLAVAYQANFETYTFPPINPNFEFKLPTDPPPVDCHDSGSEKTELFFTTTEIVNEICITNKDGTKSCAEEKKCKYGCLIAKLNGEKLYRQGCRSIDALDGTNAMKHDNGFGPMLLFYSCRTDLCNTPEEIDKYERKFYPVPVVTDPSTKSTTTSTSVSTTSSTTSSMPTTTSTSRPMTTPTTSTSQSSTISTTEKILPTEAMLRGSAATYASKCAIIILALSVFVRY